MRQYDVCPIAPLGRHGRQSGRRQLVVVLQHQLLAALQSVVVAPLVEATEDVRFKRLRPALSVNGRDYVLAIDRLASVVRRELQDPVDNVSEHRDSIRNALDLLFVGF